MSSLLIEDRGPIRILTLNRPDSLNSMDTELYQTTIDALQVAEADDNVRVIVIAGAGRSFCAGADTREFENLTPDRKDLVAHRAELTYRLHHLIPRLEKTVVAAVQGHAVGGGAGLALACDITIASASAKIGYPEIRHGLVAAVVMANLTKQIGRKAAYSLVAEGRVVDAEEAFRLGMVTRVVPEGEELNEALAAAARLAERAPSALRATKRLFQAVADIPLAEGQELGRQANEAMRAYRVEALKSYAGAVSAARKG